MEIRVVKNENGVVTYEEIVTKTVKESDIDAWVQKVTDNTETIKALEAENDRLIADIDEARNILALAAEAAE